MKVYIHPCQKKNIGDEFNRWFWHELFQMDIDNYVDDSLLVGIGTVLNDRLPQAKTVHIVGSGVGYGHGGDMRSSDWQIHFVRGYLSAQALGIDKKLAITDPGVLISRLRPQTVNKHYPVTFMPHIGIDSMRYRQFIEQTMGWCYVSPSQPESEILQIIAASDKLITSAMHGAIIADAYRVPWLPVKTSPEILPFKWHDWFSSLNIHTQLAALPAYWATIDSGAKSRTINWVKQHQLKSRLLKLSRSQGFMLSQDKTLYSRQDELLAKLAEIKPRIFPVQPPQSVTKPLLNVS